MTDRGYPQYIVRWPVERWSLGRRDTFKLFALSCRARLMSDDLFFFSSPLSVSWFWMLFRQILVVGGRIPHGVAGLQYAQTRCTNPYSAPVSPHRNSIIVVFIIGSAALRNTILHINWTLLTYWHSLPLEVCAIKYGVVAAAVSHGAPTSSRKLLQQHYFPFPLYINVVRGATTGLLWL